ncbi:MAG: GIY-YIG nuclease family protein [Patescibacteria group bacterium]|nr:GIY-YIG nuclease family protein [Patescibacteria group bacterium]
MVYFARIDIGELNAADCTKRTISLIKIGTSVNVRERIVNLRSALQKPVFLLATLPGGRQEELAFHARFLHLRLPGTHQNHHPEWFYPTRELLDFIESLKNSQENSVATS